MELMGDLISYDQRSGCDFRWWFWLRVREAVIWLWGMDKSNEAFSFESRCFRGTCTVVWVGLHSVYLRCPLSPVAGFQHSLTNTAI